ncbi:hypothetical protein B0T20DRAFT_199415 [Sordaria brevicollis]|uniref:Peptidase M20 dimerisation domain-containing protein n=1 Tax=Sordaria brevicollis TaxID=83679 RepID=A0AAE0PGM1_SORBR|nr:hypothetical protein B0T20DRAFT_199415 [Sordaria brevicollis]
MNRLALTDADKNVRDWFVEEAKGLGCQVCVDEMGNIWATRPGMSTPSGLPPVMMGSHLDTQPRGGRYDGILGIMAGLEVLRSLEETGTKTWRPIGIVCWTNEEGARFPISMVSSGVWTGCVPLSTAHSLTEVFASGGPGEEKGGGRKTIRQELERIGYLGEQKCDWREMPMAAHFELHIEQGPILESSGKKKVGVVVESQAYKWFTVEVEGREAHTGTTPYNQRADALMAAAEIIRHARALGEKDGRGILVSVEVFQVYPGSVNTIPGRVGFSFDVRSASTEALSSFVSTLRPELEKVAANAQHNSLPCKITRWEETTDSPAQLFHAKCIAAVTQSALSVLAEEVGGDTKRAKELVQENMTSGAGHDSVYTAKRCPTSMIFVPSKGGISHHPEEFTSEEDCVRGARVLLEGVVRFDRDVCWPEDGGRAREEC